MFPKGADGMANSVDPLIRLAWTYTVCPGMFVGKVRISKIIAQITESKKAKLCNAF